MSDFAILPIFPSDSDLCKELGYKLSRRIRTVANLGTDIPHLHRNADQLLASGRRCTTVPANLNRKQVVKMLESTVEHVLGNIIEKFPSALSIEQLLDIKKALPKIAEEFSEDLKQLKVDEFTFERTVLDPVLLANGAPAFEIAIATDYKHAFIFEEARSALLTRAGGNNAQVFRDFGPDDIRPILRGSIRPFVDIVIEKQLLPPNHRPVVLTDEARKVVGVTFQHIKHEGVVPMCAESVERFNVVRARLFAPGQAQMVQLSSDHYGMDTPDNIMPITTSSWGRDLPLGPQALFAEVQVDEAINYLKALEAAVNGERVPCAEDHLSKLKPLKGASLSWVDIGSPARKTTRRRWGLSTYPGERGRGKVMSTSGVQGGMQGPQWYLRQIEWLDEAAVPELGMPSNHFMAKQEQPFGFNNDVTKIIPDAARDFFRRARAHVEKTALEQSSSPTIQKALKKLRDQDKKLRAIEASLQEELALREDAAVALLAGFIGKVPTPVSVTPSTAGNHSRTEPH